MLKNTNEKKSAHAQHKMPRSIDSQVNLWPEVSIVVG